MEIVILICIFLLVWYYGSSIKEALERNNQIAINVSERLSAIDDIEKQLRKVSDDLNNLMFKIHDISRYIKVEWEFVDKHTISPMLDKLDQISALSVDLNDISNKLNDISNSVDSISGHPAFTHRPDDYV